MNAVNQDALVNTAVDTVYGAFVRGKKEDPVLRAALATLITKQTATGWADLPLSDPTLKMAWTVLPLVEKNVINSALQYLRKQLGHE